MDFQIGVVAVCFAGQQRLHLIGISALGKALQGGEAILDDAFLALGLTHLDELNRVGHLGRNLVHGIDRGFERLLFPADRLGLLRIVPQRGILHPRVEFVEPPQCAFPIERQAHQRQRRFDPVDVSMGLGPHWSSFTIGEMPPRLAWAARL